VASSITFNPMQTTGASGAFLLSTDGYVQGTFLDDPAQRFQLEGGYVSSAQATPLWGGVPITLAVPATGTPNALGSGAVAAASLAGINAWVLFNQASAGILTPSSNVPLYASGMSINFARPGSLMRVVLKINPADVNALVGAAPNVALYWDPVNLRLDTSAGGNYGPLPVQLEALSITSKTVVYSGGNANWNDADSVAVVRI
jgi:hypothetical protein